MAKVTIVCDQRFLKNVSAIERVLQDYGNFHPDETKRIANLCAGPDPVSIEVENDEQARELAKNLKKITAVDAGVKS
jgi:hypothetical protein